MTEVAIQDIRQAVHSNATITTSGSQILTGYGSQQISLIVNVKAAPTGTNPTIKFTIQEVDPGDGTTVFGGSASTATINAVGVSTATLNTTTSGTIQVSWTVTGTTPSFTQVYSTLATKVTPTSQAVTSTPSNTTAGLRGGVVTLGGGSSGTLNPIRATAYTEQSTNAQRSMSSASVNDTSAGTGARTVVITYYDASGNGPFTETITLNGTTAVNTVSTTICFIESMVITTVGSGGTNAGVITLFASTGGAGGAITSIGVGNTVAAVGDGRTLFCQHYVANGKTCSITGFARGATANSSFFLKSKPIGVANAMEIIISGVSTISTEFLRTYGSPITVPGPARITAYAVPSTNGVTLDASIDFYET